MMNTLPSHPRCMRWKGSDDEVAEVVDEIHPRAVKKVAEFLEYITQQ